MSWYLFCDYQLSKIVGLIEKSLIGEFNNVKLISSFKNPVIRDLVQSVDDIRYFLGSTVRCYC